MSHNWAKKLNIGCSEMPKNTHHQSKQKENQLAAQKKATNRSCVKTVFRIVQEISMRFGWLQ